MSHIFGSTVQRPSNALIGGITLELVRDLGIWFSNKGTHVKAQDYVAEKCKRGYLPYKVSIGIPSHY